MMSYFYQKYVNFYFISSFIIKTAGVKCHWKLLLLNISLNFSLLRIITIDVVTSMFNRDDQCRDENHRKVV